MGVQESGFDPITVVDNVTHPNNSAAQGNSGTGGDFNSAADSEAIDITIDEHDHNKVFGSQSTVPLELPPRPTTQSHNTKEAFGASLARSIGTLDAPSSPPPAYENILSPSSEASLPGDTDAQVQLLLPTALHDSGLLFQPQFSLSRVHVVADSTQKPESSAAAATTSTDTALRPSLAQIQACKPHPDALFVAEQLEWRLILDQAQLYRTPPPDPEVFNTSHLFDACSLPQNSVSAFETVPTSIAASEQRSPVQLVERWNPATPDSPLPWLEEFNLHKCWLSRKRLLSSPPDSIVTIIDRKLLLQFKENRQNDPAVGLTGPETFIRALRVLVRIIGNYIHGERRVAPTSSISLSQKLGWDQITRKIFRDLGWAEDRTEDGRNAIFPPSTKASSTGNVSAEATSSSALQMILQRHIRAWIELSVWLEFHVQQLKKSKPASSILTAAAISEPALTTRINVESASETVLEMIGERQEHIDTTLSTDLPASTLEALFVLGVTSRTRDELVKFGYLINLEANVTRYAELFACLDEVYTSQRRSSRLIQELVDHERSLGKYSPGDVEKAYERLNLTPGHLGPDVPRDMIPLDFIADSYKARTREVLVNNDATGHTAVKDAFKLITKHLNHPQRLVQALEEDVDMEVGQAYGMLDANPELDDATILVVFDLYIADAPGRRDMLRQALRAIAEDRKSEYLRHFLRTGEKEASAGEGWQQMPSADVPAGIDNIGNTCYLNSVLQYFFSITEIRNRVLQAAATVQAGAGMPDSVTDEQLQGDSERRVGGQRITTRELQRSRRFVAQLGELFHHLIHMNALSVRPERELAYLALVSSRAEELEAELNPLSENDVEAESSKEQVVEERPPILSSDPAPIEEPILASTMAEIDPMDTSPDEPPTSTPTTTTAMPSAAAPSTVAPPLPPRPARKPTVADTTQAAVPPSARRNSLMQLGAQQDVSECLDNCMFQLEVALAISKNARRESNAEQRMDEDGNENGTEQDKSEEDLLTNLFLGKTCQRIEADNLATGSGSNQSASDTNDALTRPAQPHKQPSTHIKHEVFKILPIDVLEEGRDIYDGFDGFFDSDTFVATSGSVQRRSVTLLSAPPLLQIQLQRVQYDRVTMRAFKSQAHLEMPETLYVDRYMDLDATDGANAERIAKRLDYQAKRRRIEDLRAKLAACKDGPNFHLTQTLSQAANAVEELARLPSLADIATQLDDIQAESDQAATEASNVLPAPSSPRTHAKQAAFLSGRDEMSISTQQSSTADPATSATAAPNSIPVEQLPPALSSLIDPGLSTLLRDEAKVLREQVKQATGEIETLKTEMASIWTDERRFAYRLVAVFMHRGEASHGHYFLNMRGGREDSKWFKYNDSAVTPTTLDQVLRDRSGATPYLVTYVREDYVGLIDPICRQIEQSVGMDEDTAAITKGMAGWEEETPKLVQGEEADPGSADAVKPSVVTDLVQNASVDAGSGNESPIKRARTDVA